jgi:hypothetical protein
MIQSSSGLSHGVPNACPAYAEAAVAGEFESVATAPEGDRRDSLYRSAAELGSITLSGAIAEQGIGPPMEEAAIASDHDAEIARLAALSPIEYERLRKNAAKDIKVRESVLDAVVRELRRSGNDEKSARDGRSRCPRLSHGRSLSMAPSC